MASALIPDHSNSSTTTLRLVTNSAPSKFLQLPRELRDLTYQYTLIEPRFWEKRHKPLCSKYNPPISFEYPPFATPDFHEDKRTPGFGWFQTHGCAKRRGLGLLSVNKQIHEEASSVFWDHNTFCFENAGEFTGDLDELPTVWPRVRSLSFMNFREDEGRDVHSWGREMFDILAKMPNLRDIEFQRSYLHDLLPNVLALTGLKVLRLLDLQLTYMAFGKPWEQRTFMALAKELEMPACGGRLHPEGDGHENAVCEACVRVLQKYEKIGEIARSNIYGHRWTFVVSRQMERWDIPRTREELCAVPVKSKRPQDYLEARIWGLPTSTLAQHEKAYRKEQRAKKGPIPAAKQRRPVKFVSEEDEETELARKGRPAKSYLCQQQRVDQEREAKTSRRVENRADEVKYAAAREKSALKKSVKATKKTENELEAEKKAAKKRATKR